MPSQRQSSRPDLSAPSPESSEHGQTASRPGLPGLGLVKLTVAWCITLLGMLMPWRTRILFSEALGWIAQLVPPSLYTMDGLEEPGAVVTVQEQEGRRGE
jgi:hypothetical protein